MIYQLRLIGPTRKVVAVQRFSAPTDAEAGAEAQSRREGSVSVADLDVWEGERRVHGVAPTMRAQKKPRR